MNIAEMIQMLGGNIWIFIGSFLLVITILVFVHEWGHYIVARMCGVRVESFSIGFGKEIFGYKDKAGTRWKFSLIPLGGYVKLFGDTDPASAGHTDNVEDGDKIRPMTPAEKEVAFFTKPVWKRALIVFAGPAINYIFAVILLTGLYMTSGQPLPSPTAAAIIDGSSADKYGFKPQDQILSIDGIKINSFNDIRREMMISLDQERHFIVERDGQEIELTAIPERKEMTDRFGFKSTTGLLGVISPEHGVQISKIKTINGTAYETEEEIIRVLKEKMGTTYKMEIQRGSEIDLLTVKPVKDYNEGMSNPEDPLYKVLLLSNRPAEDLIVYTPPRAVIKAIESTYSITRDTMRALGQIVTGVRSATELGGIIRIAAFAGEMAQQGAVALILFTALLSVNLGFINLLPIPLLDGGHLLFYAIESILKRPIPEQIQEYAFRAGLVFLVGVMAFANLNDLLQMVLHHDGS